ncbi:MAG TPA: AAA family ATPase [Steroidobacteraceae bacterium]|nr:AAA family ATPase [Steroidobacteraceae bacterium]
MVDTPRAAQHSAERTLRSRAFRAFAADLGSRLRAGSHLILYGPRGAGKSTLLAMMCEDNRAFDAPCGLAATTSGLGDVIEALAQAYPDADIDGLGRRAARARLRRAADRASGVLLLDHATMVTTAMLGYLRRLRGGIAGALLVVDVDTERERDRLRAWRIGALSVRMPLASDRQLHRLLMASIRRAALPGIEPELARQIAHAARGRIGWLRACVDRMQTEDYWRGGRLHLAALCTDTEIGLRESRPGPRSWRRPGTG